ncbi:MAG: hypothetical protein V2A58_17465 [Planctomycetota bacterium]
MDVTSEDIPVGVHKDFHLLTGGMIDYLESEFDEAERDAFLSRLAPTVYAPLLEDVRARGLGAIREHFARVFEAEGGRCRFEEGDGELVLHVERCPAVQHLKERGQLPTESFCEQTRVVLGELCRRAGIGFHVDFVTAEARCVQTFRARGGERP